MSHLDDLPRRAATHALEDSSIAAFQSRVEASGVFILQGSDRRDYGADHQIEVVANDRATNIRVHVQLKGTEGGLNVDGSVSVEVSRANLNYLLMHANSLYVCFHVPTESLRFRYVEDVLRQYEHTDADWTDQKTVTVSFTEELTIDRLRKLADIARATSVSLRDRRTGQTSTASGDLPDRVLRAAPDVHVPEDPALAEKLLRQLYEKDGEDAISAAFDKFAAVLGMESDAMGMCYMAEINLGMDRMSDHPERIEAAIPFFRARIEAAAERGVGLNYTIGNAFHALGDEAAAKVAFEAELAGPFIDGAPDLKAQVHKNLGSSFELLGQPDVAVAHYLQALRLAPGLAEAHNAMGNHYVRLGQYQQALHHFDQVTFSERQQGRTSAVVGWRANVLFNLNRGTEAFREINGLTSLADRYRWVWPWCARLVAAFGRTSVDNARQAIRFWQRFLGAYPSHPGGTREFLLATFYLRRLGEDVGWTYDAFRDAFDLQIVHVDGEDAAFLWGRLGHWAEDLGDWAEAERCFRRAHELEVGEYGFCLALALKHLGRHEESLPLLIEQAETLQPDAVSWFQLATSYHDLGRFPEAVEAYERAIALDPKHAGAIFDLGGAYWNSGEYDAAARVWGQAIERFPDHELATRAAATLQLRATPR